jgi:hypothetical protein
MQPCQQEELVEEKEKAMKLGFGEVADTKEVMIVFDLMIILITSLQANIYSLRYNSWSITTLHNLSKKENNLSKTKQLAQDSDFT